MSESLDRSGPNAEQIEYWNEKSGPKWVQFQDAIDARIEAIGERAIERAAPAPGERVLDVGCGCGQASLALARRVGAGGGVRGVDISAVMLTRARERARAAGLETLRFDVADAQTRAFEPGAFDLVFSRFGVMFFADPVAAFANLRTALRATGRLVFVCWRPLAENPWAALPVAALASFLPMPAPPPPGAPGPFSLGDRARLREILDEAGFASIGIERLDLEIDVAAGGGLEAAVHFAAVAGPAARLLDGAGEAEHARAATALAEALRPHLRGAGVPLVGAVWLVHAQP
jgi:SAM-dependent methyltransferase